MLFLHQGPSADSSFESKTHGCLNQKGAGKVHYKAQRLLFFFNSELSRKTFPNYSWKKCVYIYIYIQFMHLYLFMFLQDHSRFFVCFLKCIMMLIQVCRFRAIELYSTGIFQLFNTSGLPVFFSSFLFFRSWIYSKRFKDQIQIKG